MRGRTLLVVLTLVVLLELATAGAVRAELPDGEVPEGATVLDPDIVWDTRNPETIAISPDRKSVAYVSKGSLWCCDVTQGPPNKLAGLSNTATAFLAMPEYRFARSNIELIREQIGYEEYQRRIATKEVQILGLAWTREQDGIVYGLRQRYQNSRETAVQRVMLASTAGEVTMLATIERQPWSRPQTFSAFHLTPNRKYVVAYIRTLPMIWNLATSRPQVTPFDYLLPSASSSRFLGIEIDSRQLVIVDEEFKVTDRFDVTAPEGRECRLLWSHDEKFALCRFKHRYAETKWEGVRVNLTTGTKQSLEGNYFADTFWFTGRGDELAQSGIVGIRHEAVDHMVGGGLAIIPDGEDRRQTLAKFSFDPNDPRLPRMPNRPEYPLPVADAQFERFAMALPASSRPGFVYHWVDRQGQTQVFPGGNTDAYIAPFHVLGFVDGDRRILGRTESQLFSVPVERLLTAKEAKNE